MKTITLIIITLLSFSFSTQSLANDAIFKRHSHQPCWDEAARYHGVDPWLLYSIAYVESTHNPSAISGTNRNQTYDVGLMQINSWWFPTLKKYGITESHLKNACVSTYVGAWILSQNIKRLGYTWEAIAIYNVGNLQTPSRRKIGYQYALRVYKNYDKLSRLTNVTSSMPSSMPSLVADNSSQATISQNININDRNVREFDN